MDAPAMMHLERESPTSAHWAGQQYGDLFQSTADQPRSERLAWVVEDGSELQTERSLVTRPEILAFVVARRLESEWELENIVVSARVRRRGLATLLLLEFLAHARERQGTAIFLEVRESNQSARALYRKLGFQETGTRKGYYADPGEDGISYKLTLG